ncbi:MAG: hypothetical protein ACT4O2_12675 [Beijerinckiaceae bacterium]
MKFADRYGISRETSCDSAALKRLADAWNHGAGTTNLAARFGISRGTIANHLAKARLSGLPAAERKTRIVS